MTVEFKSNLGAFADALGTSVGEVLLKEAQASVENIKRGMRAPKSGKFHKGARRQSSAPGESPAVQSERLINSIQAQLVSETEVEIFSDDPKAPELEYGRIVAARPFMTPEAFALEKRLPQVAAKQVEDLAVRFAVK